MQYINARRQLDHSKLGTVEGILICDECKIKAGIVFHSTTHEIVGLTDDVNNFDSLMNILFINEDDGESSSPNLATYVNLWKYKEIAFFFLGGVLFQ